MFVSICLAPLVNLMTAAEFPGTVVARQGGKVTKKFLAQKEA